MAKCQVSPSYGLKYNCKNIKNSSQSKIQLTSASDRILQKHPDFPTIAQYNHYFQNILNDFRKYYVNKQKNIQTLAYAYNKDIIYSIDHSNAQIIPNIYRNRIHKQSYGCYEQKQLFSVQRNKLSQSFQFRSLLKNATVLTAYKNQHSNITIQKQENLLNEATGGSINLKKKENSENVNPEYIQKIRNQKILRINKKEPILPVVGKQNILITSALPYVNNVPHLGNIIGCVLSADAYARYCRLRGHNSIYICGTDEYGTATEMKAIQEKMTNQQICDKYYKIHKEIYDWFDIDFDFFGRTSTPKQTEIAQDIFLRLNNNGFLSVQSMEQQFCDKCKMFLADRYIFGTCPHCKYANAKGDQCDGCSKLLTPLELENAQCQICHQQPKIKETNHVFIDLTKGVERLTNWIEKSSQEGGWSHNSIQETLGWIKTGLKSRCITRDLKWGTPVPLDGFRDKVFYVWFDAPIGYLSITANYTKDWEQWWKNPSQCKLYQFMGKDNVPFHTVLFPSSLLGTEQNWTMLHHLSTTEYLNYENIKFSKSNKTGVFGDDAMNSGIPSEVWRYYLLANRPEKQDTVFTWDDFFAKNNNELLKNAGNLCQRILKFVHKQYNRKTPKYNQSQLLNQDHIFLKEQYGRLEQYVKALDDVELKHGLHLSMEICSNVNKYITDNAPWEKMSLQSKRSDAVVAIACNQIRVVSSLFEPFMPSLSAKINFMLGLETRTEKDERMIEFLLTGGDYLNLMRVLPEEQMINQPIVLIQQYDEEIKQMFKLKYSGSQSQTV